MSDRALFGWAAALAAMLLVAVGLIYFLPSWDPGDRYLPRLPGTSSVTSTETTRCGALGADFDPSCLFPSPNTPEQEQLQHIRVRAAGYNGDPRYQHYLGQIYTPPARQSRGGDAGILGSQSRNGEDRRWPVEADVKEALLWHTLAAAQGYPIAKVAMDLLLDDMNATDTGEVRDRVLNIYADGGPEAHYRLGMLVQCGIIRLPGNVRPSSANFCQDFDEDFGLFPRGNPVSRARLSYSWFYMAAESGHGEARYALEQLRGVRRDGRPLLSDVDVREAEQYVLRFRQELFRSDRAFTFTYQDQVNALNRGTDYLASRAETLTRSDQARAFLRQAESHLAVGNIRQAKIFLERAIAVDQNSPAAQEAARRLQLLATTCTVAPDAVSNPEFFTAISMETIQQALQALGLYEYFVDGKWGPNTRGAIREFQTKYLNANATGDLSRAETVALVCHAAQTDRDPASMNLLGIMYAQGIGYPADDNAALYWFRAAADLKHPSAMINLARMYYTGWPSDATCEYQSRDKAYALLSEVASPLGFREMAAKAKAELTKLNRRCGCDEELTGRTPACAAPVPLPKPAPNSRAGAIEAGAIKAGDVRGE